MNILVNKISPVNTIGAVTKLFRNYLYVNSIKFVVWDNNNLILRDFVKDWDIYDENKTEPVNLMYDNLVMAKGERFFFNEQDFICDITADDFYKLEQYKDKENTLVYPLIGNGEVTGLMIAKINNIYPELFPIMNISSKLISGAIINYLLNEQMEVSLNFYKAMKDIAKIIESQYELSYIIPLIGEMIDRFISSHLIYIFIRKEEKFKLVWPNACKDEQVYELLNKLTVKTDYLLSENRKIGVFPILSEENSMLGAIVAYSNIDKLLQKDIDYLEQLTRQSGMTIHRANVYAEVLKYATLDALTGLNNRRQMETRLRQEISNSTRNKLPLCCMMIDVDYFKKVNDTYGHAAGDCVLKAVSEIIKTEIRDYDIACRYGGEEFFIILPQSNINEASSVANRLRKVIEETKIDIKDIGITGIPYLKITISIGVCEFNEEMSPDTFIQNADKALYEAKETGRNRVIVV